MIYPESKYPKNAFTQINSTITHFEPDRDHLFSLDQTVQWFVLHLTDVI